MGSPYTTKTVSGYNASPPSDDGSVTASNKVTWATIKSKITDPILSLVQAINTALVSALDTTPTTKSTSYTTTLSDNAKPILVTAATTISLGDAATMGAGYSVPVVNTGTGVVAIGLITGSNTLNGIVGGTINLLAGASMIFTVNSGATGYVVTASYNNLSNNTQNALMCYMLPSTSDGWRGIYRAGFDWWSRNQQWGGPWGGEMLDSATDTLYKAEFATSWIQDDSVSTNGAGAGTTYDANGLKIAETQTVSGAWLKLYKVGNPTGNIGVFIYSDTGGKPNALITNGTATAISGKQLTSDLNGQWYRFNFSTPPTLTGGTQYHVVLKRSDAVDGSNYYAWKRSDANKYPFGYMNYGDATPTWTSVTGTSHCFLVELSSTAQTLQSGGQFDGKLQFGGSGASGALTMSRGLCNSVPLLNLMDVTDNTTYLVGTAQSKDATILDTGYGEDHDRIVLRCDVTTGYASLSVYSSTGTKTTVTSAIDISTGTHSITARVRAKGDGADVVKLMVDAATYSSTGLTINFDKNFANLGTMWVGGGFALAPTWTQKLDMSVLPSAAAPAWTWTGTATQSNAMSINGGKLFQNKNGYASTDDGYYKYASTSLSNTNGWQVLSKYRVASSSNNKQTLEAGIDICDGTKRLLFYNQEYFQANWNASGVFSTPQNDLKSRENVYSIDVKGSDLLAFLNRKLVCDGSAAVTQASASNYILFGDEDATAGANADVIYSYLAYYNTAWNPPQFTAGSISELAIWQGDMTALHPLLYNSGSFVSVKQLLGVQQNYIDKSAKIPAIVQRGITVNPTTTSTSLVTLQEMEGFAIFDSANAKAQNTASNGANNGKVFLGVASDGVVDTGSVALSQNPTANDMSPVGVATTFKSYLGLHKLEGRWNVDANTATAYGGPQRNLIVEPKL